MRVLPTSWPIAPKPVKMRVLPTFCDSSHCRLLGSTRRVREELKSVDGDGGLTLVDTVHLERPPGNAFMSIEPPTTKIFDPGDFAPKTMHEKIEESLPFAMNIPAGCVKFFEVAETPQLGHFVPFLAIGTYGKGQVDVESLYRGCGLTLDDVAHLLRPPGCIFEDRWSLSSWDCLLIAVVDAHHMWLMCQVICHFGMAYLCRFEGECWNERFHGTNATQGPRRAVPIWCVKIRSFCCFGSFLSARFY
jgi:hypothetical protein